MSTCHYLPCWHVIVHHIDPPLSATSTHHCLPSWSTIICYVDTPWMYNIIWVLVQPTRWLPPPYAQHSMYMGACSSFNLPCSSHHCICWCSPYCCSRLLIEKQLSFIPILPIGPVSTGYEPILTVTGWDWSCNCRKTKTDQYRVVWFSFLGLQDFRRPVSVSVQASRRWKTGPDRTFKHYWLMWASAVHGMNESLCCRCAGNIYDIVLIL